MSYVLTQTDDAALLPEQHYVRDVDEVLFSRFTSCIGVVARTGTTLTAVHLVQIDNQNGYFDPAAARAVLDVLGNGFDEACILGCVNDWSHSPNLSIRNGYQNLVAGIRQLRTCQIYANNDGIHSATVTAGAIVVSTVWQ
jgi:hypothetical protein